MSEKKRAIVVGSSGGIGPEIARRLAKLANAPFIKVEATKFTEVGFHGRDVDMIVRDLLEVGIALTKKVKREALMPQVNEIVNTRLLELLVGGKGADGKQKNESFRRFLESGEIEDTEVTLDVRFIFFFCGDAQEHVHTHNLKNRYPQHHPIRETLRP